MARYFGNFISRIPFLREADCDLRMVMSKGNLSTGLLYPLIGWAYNKEHFIGVFESDLGINCFEIVPETLKKRKNCHQSDYLRDEDREKYRVTKGHMLTKGYNGPESLCQLTATGVPYKVFMDAQATADFDGFYINKKCVDKVVKRNKKRCDALIKDFNILAQSACDLYCKDNNSYYGHGGMSSISPFHALLQHKSYQETMYILSSPDLLYKQPQLNMLQTFGKDAQPNGIYLGLLQESRLVFKYDDPIMNGSVYVSRNLESDTSYNIKIDPAAVPSTLKPLYKTMFEYNTPSRKPVVVMRPDSYYRELKFLSRFKNERLVGSSMSPCNGRMFRTSTQGEDAAELARDFVKMVKEGKCGTERCIILDDTVTVDELLEECRIYELTGALGGI